VAANAVCAELSAALRSAVSCPGVNVPVPELAAAAPDQYETLAMTMVSLAVAPPVVKSPDDAVAVHDESSPPRRSLTDTVPSCPVNAESPVDPEPKLTLAGAVMLRLPPVSVNVVVVPAACAAGIANALIAAQVPSSATILRPIVVPPPCT